MPYKDKKERICGFIDVEEKEKSAKFIRRYLRLDTSEGILEWFADNPTNLPNDAAPCGKVDVNYITKVDIPIKVKFKAKHCFVVNTPMRRYYFQANDEGDMHEWVEILNNASKIVVSDEEPEEERTNNGVAKNSTSEMRGNEPEDFSYKTEIVAGVIIQKKVAFSDDNSPTLVKNNDSRSNSGVPTPTSQPSSKKIISKDPFATVIKEGWGVKQGHVRKNWKRRYFVLTTSGFSYYKSEHDKDSIRSVSVAEILAAKVDNTSFSEHKDNLFFVATTDRIYYIQAYSPEDMNDWVNSFNDAVNSRRSIKHRSKGSETVDVKSEKKFGGITPANSGEVPRRRKVDATLSLASSSQRNSTQVIVGKPLSGHSQSATHSPVTYYRLSTADESLSGPLASSKSRSRNRGSLRRSSHDRRRKGSSSEESAGFGSSVDSLTASLTEGMVTNFSPEGSFPPDKNTKVYKRSCSGSDMLQSSHRAKSLDEEKNGNEEDGNRHSFPSSKNVSVQVKPENLLPSSASFSSPSKKKNNDMPRASLSSQSFSTPPNVSNLHSGIKPSRSFLLDPKVDHRAAVKPSTVKKKRNTGILFSLNNMLNKKAEKMHKSATKKRH